MSDADPRRAELAAFLRSRRERLNGGGHDRRRRTAGLTREEVAAIAGISTTWYTWLEQGREIRVSAAALERVAAALQLDSSERTHFLRLARDDGAVTPGRESISTPLEQMLAGMGLNAVYLTNHCWDVLGWSPAAGAGFVDFGNLPFTDRNVVYDFFCEPRRRVEVIDWERHARRIIAEFRASYGRHPDDPRFRPLIERCCDQSAEFARWWTEHAVADRRPGIIALMHPLLGPLNYTSTSFAPGDAGSLRLTIYTPADAPTRTKLAAALSLPI